MSFRALSPRARAGLDLARGLSALYVIAHHVEATQSAHVPRVIGVAFSFGQEAVLVFFLLSGFVIYANEYPRSGQTGAYFLRRLRRIYPLIVLAMVLSLIVWLLHLSTSSPTWWSGAATLLSLQDESALKPGVISDPFMENSPLWSLSYEVFFYIAYPAVAAALRRWPRETRLAVPCISVIGYLTYLAWPNHLSLVVAYFLVWWLGAMMARSYLEGELRLRSIRVEIVGVLLLSCAASAGFLFYKWTSIGVFPALPVRHFIVALIFALVACSPVRRWLAGIAIRLTRPAAWVASISYGLYVFHWPVIIQPMGIIGLTWLPVLLITCFILAAGAERGLMRLIPRPRGERAGSARRPSPIPASDDPTTV